MFGGDDSALRAAERCQGGFFLWATEFSCVHSTWQFVEPPIVVDGCFYYGGPETYFQLQKSAGTDDHALAAAEVRRLSSSITPEQAFAIGRRFRMRSDWDAAKTAVMQAAVKAKFSSPELRDLLLSTGGHRLVQLKPSDDFWGTGPEGDGRNQLGVLLQNLRRQQ
jgi:ribA/ribD-fused uncharacterized protein